MFKTVIIIYSGLKEKVYDLLEFCGVLSNSGKYIPVANERKPKNLMSDFASEISSVNYVYFFIIL